MNFATDHTETGTADMRQSGDAPTVTIAGREWPVPMLAPRQNRIVVPILVELMPRIQKVQEEAAKSENSEFAFLKEFVGAAIYDQLLTATYTALTRAAPDLKREDFDDMPVTLSELFAALTVIARQAGIIRPGASAA